MQHILDVHVVHFIFIILLVVRYRWRKRRLLELGRLFIMHLQLRQLDFVFIIMPKFWQRRLWRRHLRWFLQPTHCILVQF